MTGSIWQLYLFYICFGVLLNGVGPIPYGKVISHWFDGRRGLALGLTMVGIGMGAIILPAVAQRLITRFNWHLAFTFIGAAVLLIAVPTVGTFLKETPRGLGLTPDASRAIEFSASADGIAVGMTTQEATRTPVFWLTVSAIFLIGATAQGCVVHMAAIIADRGATAQMAALGSSVVGAAVLISRVGTGYLLDRLFAPIVACFLFGCVGVGVALLLIRSSISVAFPSAFLIGLGLGAEVDIIPFLISRYFGLHSFGKLFSVAFGVFVLAGALGPLAMGVGFDLTGGYRAPLSALFGTTCVAIILINRLGPYRYAPTGVENHPTTALATDHVRSGANSA